MLAICTGQATIMQGKHRNQQQQESHAQLHSSAYHTRLLELNPSLTVLQELQEGRQCRHGSGSCSSSSSRTILKGGAVGDGLRPHLDHGVLLRLREVALAATALNVNGQDAKGSYTQPVACRCSNTT
jgi:hypothetical protein